MRFDKQSSEDDMPLAAMFLVIAIFCALGGMSLGIFMGIAHDHTLAPVHAHGNLLGFVTMFLCGLYYRLEPGAVSRLAYGHFFIAVTGFALMMAELAGILTGHQGLLPIAIAGAFLSLAAMLLFLVIVVRHALAHRLASAATRARRAATFDLIGPYERSSNIF
jgi:hypothetical protein